MLYIYLYTYIYIYIYSWRCFCMYHCTAPPFRNILCLPVTPGACCDFHSLFIFSRGSRRGQSGFSHAKARSIQTRSAPDVHLFYSKFIRSKNFAFQRVLDQCDRARSQGIPVRGLYKCAKIRRN